MKILGAIITCILLGYFWIWLVQNIFAKQQRKVSRKLFGTSFVLVGSLLAFNYIIHYAFPNIQIMDSENTSIKRWLMFLVYCALIFILLIGLNNNWNKKQIWFLFLTWILLFAIVGFFGIRAGISASIIYYFILAYAEEFLKIGATENEVGKNNFYSSDLLFLSIFMALGFSIIENIFYLGSELFFQSGEKGVRGLVFGRGIFTSLLHFIATGLIALILYKLYQQQIFKNLNIWQKIWRVIIALLIGVIIHWGYNLSVQHMNLLIYIILVFCGYFLLTYLLFLSDSLYKKKD